MISVGSSGDDRPATGSETDVCGRVFGAPVGWAGGVGVPSADGAVDDESAVEPVVARRVGEGVAACGDALLDALAGGFVPGDDEPAAPVGSTTVCQLCRLRIVLARVGVLDDGSVVFGWRQVQGSRSRWCGSARAVEGDRPEALHVPLRGQVRFPVGSRRRQEARTT